MFDLRLENSDGNVVNINDGGRYEVLRVSGLTPPPASVFSSKSPNRKGRKKNGSTLDYRAIVIQIKLLGDIEKNRNDLYPWTDTETELKIYYSNATKNVYCEGTVTECDIDLFTDNEIINLAIECDNPYFKDLQEISADISALLKQFTFPFAIGLEKSYTVPVKALKAEITAETTDIYDGGATVETTVSAGIPFSTMREDNTTNVFNSGAETGAKIVVKCNGELSNLRIYDANDTSRQFMFNYTFGENWIIEIDTESSPKTVKAIKPDGTVINLLKYVVSNPTWFTLKKGDNLFGFTADNGEANAEISIEFRNHYLGV